MWCGGHFFFMRRLLSLLGVGLLVELSLPSLCNAFAKRHDKPAAFPWSMSAGLRFTVHHNGSQLFNRTQMLGEIINLQYDTIGHSQTPLRHQTDQSGITFSHFFDGDD